MESLITQFIAVTTPPSIPKVDVTSGTLAGIFGGIMMVAAVVCVVFIILGSLSYVLSAGDASKISKAKDTILYAVVGLVISGMAFLIIQLVVGIF